ncbi:MAG: ABC transporter permease, partial [Pseudomonadota bacterium]|nr:ABC transporter permease [Pseudomonadota bacterium]
MRKILLQRLLQAVLMAWSVGTLTFIITRSLPGDMAYKIAAGRYGDDAVSTSAANAVAEELGLHRSAFEQYVSWMTDLAS